jgi:hypothetical protein
MNHRKTGAWCLMLLGLISPIVATCYLFAEYPMVLKMRFIPPPAQMVTETALILVAGGICFLFGLVLWIGDLALRRSQPKQTLSES